MLMHAQCVQPTHARFGSRRCPVLVVCYGLHARERLCVECRLDWIMPRWGLGHVVGQGLRGDRSTYCWRLSADSTVRQSGTHVCTSSTARTGRPGDGFRDGIDG